VFRGWDYSVETKYMVKVEANESIERGRDGTGENKMMCSAIDTTSVLVTN